MNHSDSIAKARGLPAGAVFHRCALQANPCHYASTFQGKPGGADANAHAKAVIDKAVEIGVSVLAITDHNDVTGTRRRPARRLRRKVLALRSLRTPPAISARHNSTVPAIYARSVSGVDSTVQRRGVNHSSN